VPTWGAHVQDGDAVRFLSHKGLFISVHGSRLHAITASKSGADGVSSQFVLDRASSTKPGATGVLLHRDRIRVRSSSPSLALHVGHGSDGVILPQRSAPAKMQTFRELAKESVDVSDAVMQQFSIERVRQCRFSSRQVTVLVAQLRAESCARGVHAGSRHKGSRKSGGRAQKRSWQTLLARSATKRQRTQIEACCLTKGIISQ